MLRLFRLASALRVIYELGVELKKEDFLELTPDQYESLISQGGDANKKWFYITPSKVKNAKAGEFAIVNEMEKKDLLTAVKFIYQESGNKVQPYTSFKERLLILKSILPPAILTPPEEENENKPTNKRRKKKKKAEIIDFPNKKNGEEVDGEDEEK